MFACKDINCSKFKCKESGNFGCTVYSDAGMELRERHGYCPIIDTYFDPERQEIYMQEKFPNRKKRLGQQKTKRKS